jgi:hypothetical protein
LNRHFVVARWFLYACALGLFLSVVGSPFFVVPLALALWSKRHPRRAFGAAFGLQIVVVWVAIAVTGLSGLMALIPLVAYYCAWTGAKPDPPENLLGNLFPASRRVPIGDSWQVSRGDDGPISYPTWFFRDLGVAALAVVVVWVLRQALRIV